MSNPNCTDCGMGVMQSLNLPGERWPGRWRCNVCGKSAVTDEEVSFDAPEGIGEPAEDTVAMVPLSQLVALARLTLAMIRANRTYFDGKKAMPHANHNAAYRAARDAEKRAEAVALDALNRERQSLPGMEGGDGG